MTAQELRIGNYVTIEDELLQVTAISDTGEVHVTRPFDDHPKIAAIDWIEPIHIFPDILQTCGFEFRHETSNVMLLVIGDYKTQTEKSLQFWANASHISICRLGVNAHSAPCDSLHQLQNLYYSLTGEELQIDIDKLKNAIK